MDLGVFAAQEFFQPPDSGGPSSLPAGTLTSWVIPWSLPGIS
jgi:hypothetical protein